ncbi:MAG TPA: TIGR00366 family protein [Blastocatellia bacterium]|jgi:short-chain fatty acids transporter|nr:TIGR00366 family protein [Blastocatellia bacterium]
MKEGIAPAKVDGKDFSAREGSLARYSRLMARMVPDAISTTVMMLVVLFVMALAMGNGLAATVDAWYRGLWMLLPFTMQMTLVLALGSVLAATGLFRKIIISVSRKPRTAAQVIIYSTIVVAGVSYLNWGFALALGPLIAIHFADEAERKGIALDFPFLMAANGAAGSVWQYGLSASAPLLMATPGHFLEADAGTMSLRSSIWSPAAIFLVVGFPVVVIIAAILLMPRNPKPLSQFPAARKLAEPVEDDEGQGAGEAGFSGRMERSFLMPITLGAALLIWLYYHFRVKQASLDLNSLNTIFLLLCLLLHGNIRDFSRAVQRAVVSCWPIIVLYHLYAGIAGLIQFTTLGAAFGSLSAPVLNAWTFPLLTAFAGTVVAVFVPSSGGQWVIQGFVTLKAAEAVGVTAQRGMLALGVGDQMGNLVSPFWFVVRAEIARMDFRDFFGYGLIFALLWFVFGVAAFTFLPC